MTPTQTEPLKAYWQPGCSSCLRMKEFLQRHGVVFESINVLADKDALADLARLGIRSVPIIRRGDDWANGQVLRDVARIAGIRWSGSTMLPPEALKARLDRFLAAAQRFLAQLLQLQRIGMSTGESRPRTDEHRAVLVLDLCGARTHRNTENRIEAPRVVF